MKKIIVVALLLFSITASAQNEAAEDTTAQPAITKVGNPDGKITEMKMNKDGGTLVSGDGKLELIIPSGALSKKTTISIQPITNLVPNGNGPAYRLEPSGIRFQKPVQIIFHYTPEESADSAQLLMGIAMQGDKGQWYSLKKSTLDTVAKTISGNIHHFSDWSKFDQLKLYPPSARLKVKKSMNFEINLLSSEDELTELITEQDAELSPLKNRKIPWKAIWMANEIVNGNITEGKIAVITRTSISYTAPASLPPKNPVAITATLLGIVHRYKGMVFENLKLVSNVLIYDNAYEVTMLHAMRGMADGSTLGSVTYADLGSFVVSLEGKEAKIIEKLNNNVPDKLDYTGQCTLRQLRPGSGIINMVGRTSIRVIPPSSPTASAIIEITFSRTPTIFPLIEFTCPDGTGKTFTSTNAKANAQVAAMLPAFPQQIRFEAKEGEQTILEIKEGGIYAKFTVKQIKDDE